MKTGKEVGSNYLSITARLLVILAFSVRFCAAGSHVSDREFEELVESFAASGHPNLLFGIAESGHPKAEQVLLLAEESGTPAELIRRLDINSVPEYSYSFLFSQRQLQQALAIAGHSQSWANFVSPITNTDPCDRGSFSARSDFFKRIERLNYERVIRFLGSLLYYDDERPRAYSTDGGCFMTSVTAAFVLEKMLGEQAPISEFSEKARREKVFEMKDWWRANADNFGVDDPESDFEW